MGKGNLETKCSWTTAPQVEVWRNGFLVATAELDGYFGLMNGKEVVPMAREEWDAAKAAAKAWQKENPKP